MASDRQSILVMMHFGNTDRRTDGRTDSALSMHGLTRLGAWLHASYHARPVAPRQRTGANDGDGCSTSASKATHAPRQAMANHASGEASPCPRTSEPSSGGSSPSAPATRGCVEGSSGSSSARARTACPKARASPGTWCWWLHCRSPSPYRSAARHRRSRSRGTRLRRHQYRRYHQRCHRRRNRERRRAALSFLKFRPS